MAWLPVLVSSLGGIALSCAGGGGSSGGGGGGPVTLAYQPVGGQFQFALYLTSPPGDPRMFVVEKAGTIRIIENDQQLPVPYLDIAAKVASGGEQGLLGMAFDPGYSSNGRFYVSYTGLSNETVIERYAVSATDPYQADPASAQIVLTFARPSVNHNAGMITFGPDGYLYISSGDGEDNAAAQNLNDLLGSLLRIDVSGASGYTIPPDNPFAGGGGAPEIWSVGLRNPWRFTFDRQTGDLYIGDVGEADWEEIDVSRAATGGGRGANYGWSMLEGSACYIPPVGCSSAGTVLPVFEYDHAQGCAVIGGYVYRGAAIPALRGTYFYADLCSGKIRTFRFANGQATDHQILPTLPTGYSSFVGFGEDAAGELYVLGGSNIVYRIIQG